MAFVRKNIFTALFLLMAGVQMGWAQRVTVRMKNAQNYEFNLPDVESITFNEEDPAIGHQYVDLELPSGTLWATCNVGANTPEEYGSYYAWGETQPKNVFNWGTYKLCNGSQTTMKKYCTDSQYGTVDRLVSLEAADDVATAVWGSEWQMPSKEQLEELFNPYFTTSEQTSQNDVWGMKVTSRMNGKSIFLPAAGGFCTMDYIGANYTGEGIYGYYWTRSLLQNACYAASYLLFYQGGYNASISNYRYMGCSVRPVRRIESEPEPEPQNKESVDLGLPTGTLWATCNVGANSPEEFGSYFAWGETTPKEKYDWVSYKYGNKALWVDDWRVIKYCTNANEGDVDNKTELDPEDDAATANWGSEWQTPSLEQITELLDSRYTTITDATVNTVSGLKVTSIANGRSIFFPYCGWMVDTFLDGAEQNAGVYWSRSLDTIYSHDVWILSIHDGSKDDNAVILRSAGCAVRPVRKK